MAERARDWIGKKPIAHRGLHDASTGRIENSLSAVHAAADAGFAIEIDVRQSADGKPVVFHDATLERLTGEKGPLIARTAEELSAIRLSGVDDTIPLLSDVLKAIGGRVPLYVEIKHDTPGDGTLERAITLDVVPYSGPVATMSFHPSSVAAMREIAPDIPRGIVSQAYGHSEDAPKLGRWRRFSLRHILHFAQTRPHFIAYKVQDMPAPAPVLINTVSALPLLVWTVRTSADVDIARLTGAQMIFEGFVPGETPPAPAPTPQGQDDQEAAAESA